MFKKKRTAAVNVCPECYGHGVTRWDETCQNCAGTGKFHSADFDKWTPPAHQDFSDVHPYRERAIRQLNQAKNPEPGTHVFRGEVRRIDEATDPKSIGMHWTTTPHMAINNNNYSPEHTNVLYHGQVDHPDQIFDRSHPIWNGRHRSLDPENEVRFKPGAQVHLHGAYVWHGGPQKDFLDDPHPQFSPSPGSAHPEAPQHTRKGWQYHPIGKPVSIRHAGQGVSDYSEFGINRESNMKYAPVASLYHSSGIVVVAHDSGDGETIYHCPFCGSGQVIARSDGTVECEFCHTAFTVQVQPEMSAFPQTINGVPVDVPGMPGEIGSQPDDGSMPPGAETGAPGPGEAGSESPMGAPAPGEDPDEEGPQDDPEGKLPPASSMLRTEAGIKLPYTEYLNHLAVKFSDNPQHTARLIREGRSRW